MQHSKSKSLSPNELHVHIPWLRARCRCVAPT